MPNHCGNILRVTGDVELLDEFREFAQGYGPEWDGRKKTDIIKLDLNKFMPVPRNIVNARKSPTADAFNSGGYEWCSSNWGTKWGCYDVSVEQQSDKELRYDFSTAWSPFGTGVLEAMSERFPGLKFEHKFAEGGMGFGGIRTAAMGEVLEEYEFSDGVTADEELRQMLGLDEEEQDA